MQTPLRQFPFIEDYLEDPGSTEAIFRKAILKTIFLHRPDIRTVYCRKIVEVARGCPAAHWPGYANPAQTVSFY
jgi:hypothetical protein